MAAMLSVAKSRSDSFHDSRRQAVAGLRGDGHLRADSRSSTRSMPERARSSAIMTGRILVSAFLLLSCDGRRPAQVVVDQRSSPIVGGTSDDSHPDVVALIRGGGRPGCTGTLISTNVVVTAAHCVEASSTTPEVFFGSDVTLPGQARAVSYVRRHPTFDRSTLANDLAIVVLDEPATIAPATLGTTALDSTFTGTSLRIVGFGRGQGSGAIAGSKMQGTTLVTAVFPSSFTARPGPAQACEGDSGGPAFLLVDGQERLVGVTSAGDAACEVSASYTRIDPYVPFIQRYVEAAARTEEVGSRCYHATNCVSGARCAAATDDARISYCTKECAVSGDCPPACSAKGPRRPRHAASRRRHRVRWDPPAPRPTIASPPFARRPERIMRRSARSAASAITNRPVPRGSRASRAPTNPINSSARVYARLPTMPGAHPRPRARVVRASPI